MDDRKTSDSIFRILLLIIIVIVGCLCVIYFFEPEENFPFKSFSLERNNDNTNETKPLLEKPEKKQSIQDAVADLVAFLGETEYRFGVTNLALKNYRKAVEHLKLATNFNHSGATFNLGLCYEKGLGVRKKLYRAMECYQIASQMNHPKAMYNLGVFYAQGLGGLKLDYVAARKCFTTAAKLGQYEAKHALKLEIDNDRSNNVDITISYKSYNEVYKLPKMLS